MPPKSGSGLSTRPLHLFRSLFFCPSCSRRLQRSASSSSLYPAAFQSNTPRRRFSSQRSLSATYPTFASSSAVNGTKNVPSQFTELYQALTGLGSRAGDHLNASKLQLALRGLETEDPVIRVAVLGLGDTVTATKLVRLLLADSLESNAEWEDYLENYAKNGGSGLLIKYSEKPQLGVPNALVPTISIPSPILKKANLQLYVSSLNGIDSADRPGQLTPELLSVPTIAIPSTATDGHSPIRYPVHKTIVCGKGIDDLLAYNKLVGTVNSEDAQGLRAVFTLNSPQISPNPQTGGGVVTFVDAERAEIALTKFRESVQNASEYEQGWLGSGVQPLFEWLSKEQKGQPLHPDVRRLVDSTLRTAGESVEDTETKEKLEQKAKSVPDDVRDTLGEEVSAWSERSHTELRDTLNEGFESEGWRKLTWWKLFWRTDDVGMLMASILEKHWLPHAEKEAIWLSGRIQQAGLLSGDGVNSFNEPSPNEPLAATTHDVWTSQIGKYRTLLMNTRVPSLHAVSQRLVAFSASTTSLASVLSILTYVSTSSTSVYEASTIAAVALIYCLRRQQKRWDSARKTWESEVREEGRKALKETEDSLRAVIKDGGRRRKPMGHTETRTDIENAKRALSNVK